VYSKQTDKLPGKVKTILYNIFCKAFTLVTVTILPHIQPTASPTGVVQKRDSSAMLGCLVNNVTIPLTTSYVCRSFTNQRSQLLIVDYAITSWRSRFIFHRANHNEIHDVKHPKYLPESPASRALPQHPVQALYDMCAHFPHSLFI